MLQIHTPNGLKRLFKNNNQPKDQNILSGTGGKGTTYRILPNLRFAYALPIVIIFAGFGVYTVFFSSAAPTDTATAHLWVHTSSSGSCTRTSSKQQYNAANACNTIQAAANIALACDVVVVKSGVYTNYSTSGNTAAVTVPSSANGSASCKTTFAAEKSWRTGQKSEINASYNARYGFNLSGTSNVRVEGFEIYGIGPPSTSNVDSAAIWAGNNAEIVGNNIHDIGGCINVANDKGQNGIFLDSDNTVIEQNYIHHIGRSTNCTTDRQHDHGIYVNGSGGGQTGNIIRNNLFYQNTEGWAVQIYPGTINELRLVHNTFAENAASNGTKSGNSIITGYGTTISNSTISNNIFYNTNGSTLKTIEMGGTLNITNVELKNNITSGNAISDNATHLAKFTGTATNQLSKIPTFVSTTNNDYHLTSADTIAKDRAVDTTPVTTTTKDYDDNDRTAPKDIGAFEYQQLQSGGPTANLWVDTNGGSCTRQATAGAYNDGAACSSIDAAWDKCIAGTAETIIIKTNATQYGTQTVTGNKASPGCKVIGEDGVKISALHAQATYFSLENTIIDVGNSHGYTVSIDADNVTLRDTSLYGPFVSMQVNGNGFTWQDGSFGQDGTTGQPRRCDSGDGQGIWVDGNNTTIDGIRFNPQKAAIGTDPSCGADNNFHLELIRVQGAQNVTVKNSWFLPGSDAGSGHIFVTNTQSSSTAANGLKVINNIFEPVNGSYSIQVHNNVQNCGWLFAYNTFYQDVLTQCNYSNSTWVGNLGAYYGCKGSQIKNVYYSSSNFTCGTNTRVNGTNMASLGVGSGGRLNSGSPAINAAETDSATDYCTNVDVGSRDFEKTIRPQNTACDAGADEYTSTVNPPTCSTLPGDTNNDNIVNIADISAILALFGQTNTTNCADVNKDQNINISDISLVLSKYGT